MISWAISLVRIVFVVVLVQCARDKSGMPNDCNYLLDEAIYNYYEGGLDDGTPDSRCRYMKENVPRRCLRKEGICMDSNTDRGKRDTSSSLSSLSEKIFELAVAGSGRITKRSRPCSNITSSALETESCPDIDCQNERNALYRTLDGRCNNLEYGHWGMADRAHSGFIWSDFDDGCDAPRTTGKGGDLPSAREVSNMLHEAEEHVERDPKRSSIIMQIGQFLAHDVSHSTTATKPNGGPLDCCGTDKENSECFGIKIPLNDSYFTPGGCIPLARSRARRNCINGARESINGQTPYLDLSMQYGVTEAKMNDLRVHTGGLLKEMNGKLPRDHTNRLCVLSMPANDDYYCPLAADPRVSETVGLASMHTLWVREHNRIAKLLALKHTSWVDERLFQEARKITIAEWQNVVFGGFLPAVLGERAMIDNRLAVTKSGFADSYSSEVDPTVANSFATAAFRFGHSLIQDKIALAMVDDGTIIKEDLVKNNFFVPDLYHANDNKGPDNILKWLSDNRSPLADRKLQPSVQRFLFKNIIGDRSDLDLASLNIQRGRDHGLPGYNDFREYVCKLPRAKYFGTGRNGLLSHTEENVELLRRLYKHVDEIDLYPGFLSEIPEPGSQLGPTGMCLMVKQFKNLKDGDRFFYERSTSDPANTFTLGQLNEIKKVRLSTLFCLNTAEKPGKKIPENMFFVAGPDNGYVNCSSVEGIDMNEF